MTTNNQAIEDFFNLMKGVKLEDRIASLISNWNSRIQELDTGTPQLPDIGSEAEVLRNVNLVLLTALESWAREQDSPPKDTFRNLN